jgi:hypothetical protein
MVVLVVEVRWGRKEMRHSGDEEALEMNEMRGARLWVVD